MGAWEVGQLVIYEKTMQPFFISSNQQPSLLACDLFHRLLGDEESHVVPQSVLDIGRPWWWEQWWRWWWCSLWRWPGTLLSFKRSITSVVLQCSFHPESWMEQDLAPSSFLGGNAHLSWVRCISTFAVNKIYAHDAPFELTSNLGCNAHLSWVRCISTLLPFAGGLWWWCNWLVAAEWVTVASMSQSTFKHESAAAIFFPSAWRFIWVLCQTLPRASQPVGWLRGSVKGLALLHEGSRKFYANPFPKLASLKTSDWSGLGRDGFWGTHHGISINIWCKLEKHQLVKDILARCMNLDETRRRSCVDLWMGLEDMRGVSEKAAAEHCGWDLICGRGPRKGYN